MLDLKTLSIAMVCYEANRAYCRTLNDLLQPEWDDAPDWQRDSVIKGVIFVIANPEVPYSAQHDAWMADKIKDGWTYGEVKDVAAKTHPCLVPFDQLPEHQQAKDRLFRTIVKALS